MNSTSFPSYRFFNALSCGISFLQGGQLVNQKFKTTTLPLRSLLLNFSTVNFNDEVNQALDQKVHWMSQSNMYTTKKGDQISDILTYEDEIFKQLTDLFSSKVLEYLNSIEALNLSYFNVESDTLTYNIWAVRLNSEGYQDSSSFWMD